MSATPSCNTIYEFRLWKGLGTQPAAAWDRSNEAAFAVNSTVRPRNGTRRVNRRDEYYVMSFCFTFLHGFVTILSIDYFPFHQRWCQAWKTGMAVSRQLSNKMDHECPIWIRVLGRLHLTTQLRFKMEGGILLGMDMVGMIQWLVWMWTIWYVFCSMAMYCGSGRGLSRTTRPICMNPYRVTYPSWALCSMFRDPPANDFLDPNTQDFLLCTHIFVSVT